MPVCTISCKRATNTYAQCHARTVDIRPFFRGGYTGNHLRYLTRQVIKQGGDTHIDAVVRAETVNLDPVYLGRGGVAMHFSVYYRRSSGQWLKYSVVKQSRVFLQCGQTAKMTVRFLDPSRSSDYGVNGSVTV